MSAAVLSGVGIFANTVQANAAVQSSATNASQVRGVLTVVDHQKGEVHLYDRDGNIMKQTVKNGKAYKVWEKAMINGELMYRIGTDKQWIPAKYTNWDNAKVGQRVNVALPSKSAVSNRQNYAGAVRVNYQGQGKVRLLNDQGKYMPQYAAKNSTWRVWEKATINHELMYRIGTQSQWIPAKYVAPVQTQTSTKAAPVVHANTNKQVAKPVVKPAKPAQPAQNHNAVKPSVPAKNTQVNHNTSANKPALPSKPAKPATPVTPAKPSTNNQNTAKPSQPVKPAQPTQPANPTTPTKPVQPSQPVQNKTGLDAITTDEAAAYAQTLYDQVYEHGNMDDYNKAARTSSNYMTIYLKNNNLPDWLQTTYTKADIYNEIKENYDYWQWGSPESIKEEKDDGFTHAVAKAVKHYDNDSLDIYQYRY